MKKTCYLLTLLILTLSAGMTRAQKITILGTNDTHSQIDPDERGRSGALQRKAVIDSVRKADKTCCWWMPATLCKARSISNSSKAM